jgi:hypothetical protein
MGKDFTEVRTRNRIKLLGFVANAVALILMVAYFFSYNSILFSVTFVVMLIASLCSLISFDFRNRRGEGITGELSQDKGM